MVVKKMLKTGSARRLLASFCAVGLLATACSSSSDGGSVTAEETPQFAEDGTRVINIGWAMPDVGAFALLNDKFDVGDTEEQANAVLRRWELEGLLPDGISVNLKVRSYETLNGDQKRAACSGFVQDDDVFAIVGGRDFLDGATCIADAGIPAISQDGGPSTSYNLFPNFFSIRPSESEVLESFVAWGDENGIFEDRKIGVFWDFRSEQAINDFKAALSELGIELAVDLGSNGEGIGSPEDALAVQRFIDADVDTAIMLVGTSSVTNFMADSNEQGYKPDYLGLEWAGQIVDVSTASLNQEQFDGTRAMAASRAGEIAAGRELNTAARVCLDAYADFAGQPVEEVSPESAEYVQVLQTCDVFSVLLEGLQNAGGVEMTRESFVDALEGISGHELAYWGDVSYAEGDHSGVSEFRTVEWQTECECWTALDEFAPFG